MNFQAVSSSIASSFQGKYLPDCRKTLEAVQDIFKPEKCKQSLEHVTFQNKVALRRSLKNSSGPLGSCVTQSDFRPLPQDYFGPVLREGEVINEEFIKYLSSWFSEGGVLPPSVLYSILKQAELSLRQLKSSLVEVPLTEEQCIHVCGDIHGQLKDLNNIFFLKGQPSSSNLYLFNGDIVDRGPASIQCIVLLLAMRTAYPSQVMINRGNHEATSINLKDGFHGDIMETYGDSFMFDLFQELFSLLPAATLVANKVLVLHGGLSNVKDFNLDDIRGLPLGRGIQPEDCDILCDILWSDPMVIGSGIKPSSRGGGVMFGSDVTSTFLNRNNLQCLVRSHTEIREGCLMFHPGCYTVFSAPNRDKGVLGGVLSLHPTDGDELRLEGFVFQQVKDACPSLQQQEENTDQ